MEDRPPPVKGWAEVSEHFARRAWHAVDDTLIEVDYAGRPCFVLAEDVKALTSGERPHGLRWFVEGIEGAKKPETRQRRVEAAVARLREGRGAR